MLQQWHDFCGREETNYLLPDVTLVLKFFTELYEKGSQYSSITLARSALASVVTLREYATLSHHPLIKRILLSGMQIYYQGTRKKQKIILG